MNYSAVYDALINKRRASPVAENFDRHHIVPRCLGGKDEPNNVVQMTVKEHYVAHLLLAKIHGGVLWYPVHLMARRAGKGSRHYTSMRKQLKPKRASKALAQWQDPEMAEKMREGMKGKQRTSEYKSRVSKAMKEKWADPAYRAMATEARRGRVMSEQTKAKMRDAQRRRRANERSCGI